MGARENPGEAARLRDFLDREAKEAGFDVVAVTGPTPRPKLPARLAEFIDKGRHGTMEWMKRRRRAALDRARCGPRCEASSCWP
jgi:epoxyqueuosine reductase